MSLYIPIAPIKGKPFHFIAAAQGRYFIIGKHPDEAADLIHGIAAPGACISYIYASPLRLRRICHDLAAFRTIDHKGRRV